MRPWQVNCQGLSTSIPMQDFIDHLQLQLQKPLPGRPSEFSISPADTKARSIIPDNAKLAGVLVLFYPKNKNWHLVLIERTSLHEGDRHKGQISFPGGRHEEADESMTETALREAEEEVGVKPEKVEIIGSLSDLYIPVSNFRVFPKVAFAKEAPSFVPQPSEVANILEVPFHLFQQPEALMRMDLPISNGLILPEVPHFKIFDKIVWGATLLMLGELLAVVGDHKLK